MIWATVSYRSCFCWLYRASQSLAAENITSLISELTIWLCPCVESSLVCWKRMFAMISMFSWQNSILDFVLLHSVLQGQICLLLQVFLDFLLLHSSPLWGTRDQTANIHDHRKSKRVPEKHLLLLYWLCQSLWLWITIHYGKFFKRWEYQTTWPASWETYMQLELDMEQQTGSK